MLVMKCDICGELDNKLSWDNCIYLGKDKDGVRKFECCDDCWEKMDRYISKLKSKHIQEEQ